MVLVPFIYMYRIRVSHMVLIYTYIQFIVVGCLHTGLYCGYIRISANAERSRGVSRIGNRTMDIRYIVIAETGSWGAAKTLRQACRRAYLIEDTRLSHFEHSVTPEEFAENWRTWKEWGFDDWRYTDHESINVVIYPLDMDQWQSYSICGITGALSALPKDESMTGGEASKRLREICIRAEWNNGSIKPTPGAA